MNSKGFDVILLFLFSTVIFAEDGAFDLNALIDDVTGQNSNQDKITNNVHARDMSSSPHTAEIKVDCHSDERLKGVAVEDHILWPTVFGLRDLDANRFLSQSELHLKLMEEAMLSSFDKSKRPVDSCWVSKYADWAQLQMDNINAAETSEWLQRTVLCQVNQYLQRLTEFDQFDHFQPSEYDILVTNIELHADGTGCYVPPSSCRHGDFSVLVGLGVGETHVPGNMVYFMDPRPAAGTLAVQGWLQGTIPLEWEIKPGNMIVFPSHLKYHMVANRNMEPRSYAIIDVVLLNLPTDADLSWHMPHSFKSMTRNSTFFKESCPQQQHRPSDFSIISKWATTVLVVDLPLEDSYYSELTDFILNLEQNEPSVLKSNKGGWQSSTGLFKLDNALLVTLNNWTSTCVFDYLRRSRKQLLPHSWSYPGGPMLNIVIDLAWASVNRMFDSNAPHIHPHSIVSGAFYMSLGSDPETSLYFTDPRHSFLNEWSSFGQLQTNVHRFQAMPGRMILFPGWLEHYVKPHTTNNPRISISFNTLVEHSNCLGTTGERSDSLQCFAFVQSKSLDS